MSQYITKNKLTGAQINKQIQNMEEKIAILETENIFLHNIISHVPGNVFWKNAKGEYLGCNNSQAKFFNLSSPEKIIGKRNQDFLSRDIAEELDKTDMEIITSGKEHCIEEAASDTNAQPVCYLTKKTPLYDQQGKLIGIIGVGFDITERKRMEKELVIAKQKAEASDHAKSQFLAVMNHELNTPLASIIGLIDLLKHGGLPKDEEKNIIETIEKCTHHLLGLVNEVLDFSKLEKHNYIVDKSYVNLTSLVKEVYNLLYIPAKEKKLKLKTSTDQNFNKAILTNSSMLLQILINLINNAIKFTNQGQVNLQVNILDQTTSTCMLEIVVSDTGNGIAADKLELIFEPFQQLEDGYTRQSSRYGTGLGLAIVKKLSEQLGMEIKVQSTLGQGSTFTLTGEFKTCDSVTPIPELSVATKKTNKITIKTSKLMIAAKQPRILLVEDDPVIQYIHKKMLEDFKCRVDVTAYGRDAIKILDQYDIAFVDISLPDINGFEVIQSMREFNPACKTPIVALTVHNGKKEKQSCLNAGANKFATKPISRAQLRKILMKYVINV